mgnify:FL=1
MNNAILFFYNINIQEIKKITNNYYFTYLNNNYGIYLYNRDPKEQEELFNLNNELLMQGLVGYEIIPTKDKQIIFIHENKPYILMKLPNIKNKIITYEDIINFKLSIDTKKYKIIDKSNWSTNWSNKIDFINYQFSQVQNKYPVIENSIDYFIGIWENAISYANNNPIIKEKTLAHKRITTKTDLLEFLNPLNFIIDYQERDVGEYIKSYIMTKNYSNDIIYQKIRNLPKNSIILIITRILFPSYYFDIYEDIILKNRKEEELKDIINKRNNITELLNYIFDKYSNYNIPYIEWIKK